MNSRKALLIENDESYLRLTSGALAGLGFKSLVVRGGGKAPELVKQELPDLIVLAVELPGVNGYIVCKKIKETEETKRIPLILISSGAKPEDFERHRKLRIKADEYLLKPFSKEDLLQKVNTIIDKGEQLREEGKIPSEQRAVLEDTVMVQSKELATFKQLLDKIKHQNKTAIEKLRSELKEKTESEERLSRMLATEREGFQQEKAQLETKLLKEIDELREEKNRLKTNISELEEVLQKSDQSEEIKKRLVQALAERDRLKQQYQATMKEKNSLSEDIKRELEEKGNLISKSKELQGEMETLQERLKDREEKVAEAEGLIEKSKGFESELIRKTEGLEKEISSLKKKKDSLKTNISELEVLLQKGDQSNALEQAFAERDKFKQQYQATLEEKSSLIEDLKRELEEKGNLISKSKELQGEIEALQGRLREREEKVVEAEGLPEELEELEAQPEPSEEKKGELEKEIPEAASTETLEVEEAVPEAVPIGRLKIEKVAPEAAPRVRVEKDEKVKRSSIQLGIIGGVVALLVFSLAALYFLTDIFSPSRSPSRLTPEPTTVVSVPATSKKTIEKAETEPREGKKEEQEAPEPAEKKEEVTTAKAETKPPAKKKEVKTAKKAPIRKPKTKPPVKVAKKEVPRYTVQVGVYKNKANLDKVAKSLKKLGLDPYTVRQQKKGKKKLYHVYLDRKFILGETIPVSMKLSIFEIKNKKIKQKDGKYSIFAGKFPTLKKAQEAKQKIKDAGYAATITPKSSTQLLYICRAGKFSTKKEADRVAGTLRKSGYKPETVELKK